MEHKVGDIFEYEGIWYQCIKGDSCGECALLHKGCLIVSGKVGLCNDKTKVVFKELKKKGEPVTKGGRTFQCLDSRYISCVGCVFNEPNKACCKNSYIDGPCPDKEIWVETKQDEEGMEEKKEYENKLRIFNLEEAKAGKPVCTRDRRKVRIICFDCKDETFPIVALVSGSSEKEEVISYDKDGYSTTREGKDTLFMLPEKREGWINIYQDMEYNTPYTEYDNVYSSMDKAKESAKMLNNKAYVDTIKIKWER